MSRSLFVHFVGFRPAAGSFRFSQTKNLSSSQECHDSEKTGLSAIMVLSAQVSSYLRQRTACRGPVVNAMGIASEEKLRPNTSESKNQLTQYS
ncbi:hypothetical protein BDW66DRAFT_124660 [Aspergillus desertorum]